MGSLKEVILIVDDEIDVAMYHSSLLQEFGYLPLIETNPLEVPSRLLSDPSISIALLDMRMPESYGLEVLRVIKRLSPHVGVIMATVVNDIAEAVQATKNGAYNYLLKPLQKDRLGRVIESYLNNRPKSLTQDSRFRAFVTNHRVFEDIFRRSALYAEQDIPVLITGETGTGKEIMAELIHTLSDRKQGPFIPVNISAISGGLFESELFGHVKGAFTGSVRDKVGFFERASDGTLFLDEIGELPLEHQAKLLRVLQSRKFNRVGSSASVDAKARVVFATNRDLKECVERGTFREDLYFRISNHELVIPPLRERQSDIELLAHYFLNKYNAQYGRWLQGISAEAILFLRNYPFPGNVRELEGIMSSAVLLEQSTYLSPNVLPPHITTYSSSNLYDKEKGRDVLIMDPTNLKNLKKQKIIEALLECGGNQTKAAIKLGISRVTLNRWLKQNKEDESITELLQGNE